MRKDHGQNRTDRVYTRRREGARATEYHTGGVGFHEGVHTQVRDNLDVQSHGGFHCRPAGGDFPAGLLRPRQDGAVRPLHAGHVS